MNISSFFLNKLLLNSDIVKNDQIVWKYPDISINIYLDTFDTLDLAK